MVKTKIREEKNKVSFRELAKWAETTEIGSPFVLYAIVKDLIDRGELIALEGYEELPELMMWKVPKIVALPEAVKEDKREVKKEDKSSEKPRLDIDFEKLDEDLRKALTYLSEYWSVGEIRFMLDLRRMGVQNPTSVLAKLLDLGVVELTASGVVNLKVELPRIKKKTSLAGLI